MRDSGKQSSLIHRLPNETSFFSQAILAKVHIAGAAKVLTAIRAHAEVGHLVIFSYCFAPGSLSECS